MKRRALLKTTGWAALGCGILPSGLSITHPQPPITGSDLDLHRVNKWEIKEVAFHWPRFVGKNGRRDDHGQHHRCTVLKLYTDQGAMGWGLSAPDAEKPAAEIVGKKVSELIQPITGRTSGLARSLDFALHDLMGVILQKPVYQLLGAKGARSTPIYSGMIYLEELNRGNRGKGMDAILDSCDWDMDYGYHQLKVKIGRSGRWYAHDEGLQKDIEVVQAIWRAFRAKGVKLLVDANDMYSYRDTIDFLKGVEGIPLYWLEEPFRESVREGRKLRSWMDRHGFANTLYADGEADPAHDLCLQMGADSTMDVFLPDIYGLGFTEWVQLMSRLKTIGMLASPHAWGNRLKTHYIAHLAAGLGGIPTIEGVSCFSDEIDYGDYILRDGRLEVPETPGFGMKLWE